MPQSPVLDALRERVQSQKERNPAMYGNVDFSIVPERFADQPEDDSSLSGKYREERPALLADPERMAFIRA